MVELAESVAGNKKSTLSTNEIKRKVRQAADEVDMEHMLSRLSCHCFSKCVPRPHEALNESEESCILLCADRYADSYDLVAQAFVKRIQHELKRGLELKKAKQKAQDKLEEKTQDRTDEKMQEKTQEKPHVASAVKAKPVDKTPSMLRGHAMPS